MFTRDEIDKEVMNAVTSWDIVHKKYVEEKHKLCEELPYEKVAREALPIHLDNNILKNISILNNVRKNDNDNK